jgi:uncharacterized repeat protein (TIGR01451 family)
MRRTVMLVVVAGMLLASAAAVSAIDLSDFKGKIPPWALERKGVDISLGSMDSRATGGPDAAGYLFADSNEVGGPTFDWVEINGSGTQVLLGDDEVSAALPIGFTFDYYGTPFTELYAVSNGFLSFGDDSSTFTNQCPLPNAATPNNLIAPLWDDLDPFDTSDPLYYQTFAAGSCPWNSYSGACFVVEYEDFCFYPGGVDCTSAGTFEVIFFDNNEIVLQYLTAPVDGGAGATVGIENADGSIGLTYSCDSDTLTDSLAIQYGITDQAADLVLTKTASATDVPVGGSFTFTIDLTNDGPQTATGVVVTDTLSSDLTYVSDTCGGSGAPNWTWNVGTLAADASTSCTITVSLNDCNIITNTATATANEIDPPGNSTDTVTINQSAAGLQDGSFEATVPGAAPGDPATNPFWDAASAQFGTPFCDLSSCGDGGGTAGARTGDWWVWFGGATANETGNVNQDATLTGTPTLSFYLWAPVPSGSGTGTMDVLVDGNSVFQVTQGQAPYDTGYQLVEVDLTAYADGGVHNIRFESSTVNDVVTFNVDDVFLPGDCGGTGANVDLSLTKQGYNSGAGMGGYQMVVSNAGPDAATNVVVSDPLPAGVTHMSDTCGGVVNMGTWTWTIPSLAAGAQASCDMTVAVNDSLDTANTATASSPDSDSDASNNAGSSFIPEQAEPAIPTLSTWGIALLAMLMGGIAVWFLRRRR